MGLRKANGWLRFVWPTLACLVLSWRADACPAAADAAAPSATGVATLRCGTLIDGRSATARREVAIHIEDGRIVSVGAFTPGTVGPMNGAVIDRSRDTCLPGLIDAHSAAGIKASILAGARTIEHGTFIDDEGIRLLKEKGVYLVPTLYVGDYYLNEQPASEAQAKMNELAVLVEAGMTPMRAIQAATRVNSELLGWQDRIGTVETGKLADIIAVKGDPLQDLAVLEKVSFVMLGGREIASP